MIAHSDDGYLVTTLDDTILYANLQARQYLGLSTTLLHEGARFRNTALHRYHCEPEEAWVDWPLTAEGSGESRYLIRQGESGVPSSWLLVELLQRELPGMLRNRLIRLHDVSELVSATCSAWTLESMVSHKLKTPLTILMTSLEMINLDRNRLPPDMRELVELSHLSVQRLHQDVTLIARFGERQASPASSHFHLAELPDLVDRLGTTLQLRRVAVTGIRPEVNPSLPFSTPIAETILAELFENAAKFHPEHDPSLTVAVTASDDGRLTIRVMDDGVSLSPCRSTQSQTHWGGANDVTGGGSNRGRGLPMVAALLWESGGSFRLYNRNECPGVIAELILPITSE